MALANFRAFWVVSLPVSACACGSDGAMSAMRVLIYPTGGLPRVPLQECLSGTDPLLTATTVTVRSINMFDSFLFFRGSLLNSGRGQYFLTVRL